MGPNASQALLGTLLSLDHGDIDPRIIPVHEDGPRVVFLDSAHVTHVVYDPAETSRSKETSSGLPLQALRMLNGTIYYGMIRKHHAASTLGIEDPYYLIASKNGEKGELQLVRSADELAGLDGELVVNMTYVVSWHTVSPTSVITVAVSRARALVS